jgi:hypothetical protein
MTGPSPNDGDIARARYQFAILSDAAAELGGARYPRRILESFALSAQGGVGARGAFAAILGDGEFELMAESGLSRNLKPEYARVLRDHLDALEGEPRSPYFVPALEGDLCPGRCQLLLVCPLDEGRDGVLGLEANLAGRAYDENDRQLVAGLGALFQTSLRFSLFAAQVEQLNAELRKRNIALDRQIYHLSAMSGLSREIIRVDTAEVMDTFLLNLVGHFSRPDGLLVLHDRESGVIFESARGGRARTGLSLDETNRLFYLCLAGARDKRLRPLRVERVEQLDALAELSPGFEPHRVFIFMLREGFYGVLLLGRSLDPAMAPDDEPLEAFVAQGVMHLKNADSFATITNLNMDLARQNEELRTTIAELTSARDRISVLEATGRRIAAVVHSKARSLERVRLFDLLLIVFLSLGLALAFNTQNPRGIPLVEPPGVEVEVISAAEAARLLADEDALLVDARPREFFEQGSSSGAVNVPAQLFDLVYMMQMASEDPERPVVVFGRSVSRRYDLMVARKFLGRDHERVFIVTDVKPGEPIGGER